MNGHGRPLRPSTADDRDSHSSVIESEKGGVEVSHGMITKLAWAGLTTVV